MRAACGKPLHLNFGLGKMRVVGGAFDHGRVVKTDRLQHQTRFREIRRLEHISRTVAQRAIAKRGAKPERGFVAEQDDARFEPGKIERAARAEELAGVADC